MENKKENFSYILITPAYNEEKFIEKTIQSVISQTLLPKKWVIVSDGSTDRTDEIIKKYLPGNPWIELLRMPEHKDRNFGAKVFCFNAGFEKIRDLDYDVIGNLDADISFESDLFEFLINKFIEFQELGVAGTYFVEENYSSLTDSFEGKRHVSGQCQLFRKKCFEDIEGYVPHRAGGIDWIAVTTARMKGWKTQSFQEKHYFHHRHLGTGGSNRVGSLFKYGMKDYYLGGHPLWEVFRVVYRFANRPYIIGGLALMSGYLWASFKRINRPVSIELMKFHRREQMEKLKIIFKNIIKFGKIEKYNIDF